MPRNRTKSIRVRNIEAQREAIPLRRPYEGDVVEPLRTIQSERVNRAREEHRDRKSEIADSMLSIEERLDASRQALRSMRKAVVTIYRELKPQAFGAWLQERDELREQARQQSERSYRHAQRHERGQEAGRDRHDGLFIRAEQGGIRDEPVLER